MGRLGPFSGSRIATGPEAGQPWRRLGDRVDPASNEDDEASVEPGATVPPRCVRQGGMSLHADVAVPARDRRRLERLCRYVARPPLTLDRLVAMPRGRLAYRLKTPWRDGTTHVLMKRHELLERLAPLIPPPRAHQVRYHGVLAPCASGRDRVVPGRTSRDEREGVLHLAADAHSPLEARTATLRVGAKNRLDARPGHEPETVTPAASEARLPGSIDPDPVSVDARARLQPFVAPVGTPPRRTAWADLLMRVFEVDALRCPKCGGRMRVLSAITDPIVASRILQCLSLPPRAPPRASAKDGELVAGRAGEEWLDEVPEFDFDQSSPSGD